MIGYIISIGILYLFLRFQVDRIHNPIQPKKLKSYTTWIESIKSDIKKTDLK